MDFPFSLKKMATPKKKKWRKTDRLLVGQNGGYHILVSYIYMVLIFDSTSIMHSILSSSIIVS
jgi:hypothetical protein